MPGYEGGIHLAQQIPEQIGQVVVQDAASQCVSHIAAPQPGEHGGMPVADQEVKPYIWLI